MLAFIRVECWILERQILCRFACFFVSDSCRGRGVVEDLATSWQFCIPKFVLLLKGNLTLWTNLLASFCFLCPAQGCCPSADVSGCGTLCVWLALYCFSKARGCTQHKAFSWHVQENSKGCAVQKILALWSKWRACLAEIYTSAMNWVETCGQLGNRNVRKQRVWRSVITHLTSRW